MGSTVFFCTSTAKSRINQKNKQLIQYTDILMLTRQQRNLLYEHFQNLIEQITNVETPVFTQIDQYTLFEKISLDMLFLIKQKKLSAIDLIDIIFLLGIPYLIDFVLLTKNILLDKNLQYKAIVCGNINTLIYLEEKGLPINYCTMFFAIETGNLNILKFCVNRGIYPNKDSLDDAAIYGRMDILRYLINERNIKPDKSTVDCSIMGSGISHRNREATNYIFEIVYKELMIKNDTLCLK